MSPTSNPDGGPTLEPVPDSGSVPDAEEAGTDPLEPVPSDGRDAQPVVGSSDDGAAMAMDDPLREAVYVEEEDLPFVDEEAEELEDEGACSIPKPIGWSAGPSRKLTRSWGEARAKRMPTRLCPNTK